MLCSLQLSTVCLHVYRCTSSPVASELGSDGPTPLHRPEVHSCLAYLAAVCPSPARILHLVLVWRWPSCRLIVNLQVAPYDSSLRL